MERSSDSVAFPAECCRFLQVGCSDGARKEKPTPVRLELKNTGLYDINEVSVFADGKKIGDYPVNLKFGGTATIDVDYTVPADCPDQPLTVTFGLSSRESQVIESEKDATLGTGHIYVTYSHQFVYAETLFYNITNNGFAGKTVYGVVLDEKTGEVLNNYPVHLAPGASTGGSYSILSGLWRQEGHENIQVAIRLEGEDISDLNSTRFTSFKSLEEIYLQDNSGMPVKNDSPSNDEDDGN